MDTDRSVPALLALLALVSITYGLFVVHQPILWTLLAGVFVILAVGWRLVRAST